MGNGLSAGNTESWAEGGDCGRTRHGQVAPGRRVPPESDGETLEVYTRVLPLQHRPHAFLYGQDPGLACLAYAAWTLCLLGYADQARQKSQQLRTLLREVSHPFRLAYIRALTAMFHYHLREEEAVQEWAEAVIALSTEHGFPLWRAAGTI